MLRKYLSACTVCLIVLLCISCDGDVKCVGCKGTGVFVYAGHSFKCQFCEGKGVISESRAKELCPDIYDAKPVRTDKYCVICMGTGKFRVNTFPFESVCTICQGNGVCPDDRNNTDKPLYKCVYCNGTRQSPFGGQCTFCRGYGVSLLTPQQQDGFTERTNPQLCGACGGRTTCPACRVTGGVKYGDIQYCSVCGGTGKCRWCYGRGY